MKYSCPNANLSYCDMNVFEKAIDSLNSYTPLGIKMWVLMALGIGAIVLFNLVLLKLGFFDEKKQENKNG